jgi:hypothetical protein
MYGVSALKLLEAFRDGRTDQTAEVLPRARLAPRCSPISILFCFTTASFAVRLRLYFALVCIYSTSSTSLADTAICPWITTAMVHFRIAPPQALRIPSNAITSQRISSRGVRTEPDSLPGIRPFTTFRKVIPDSTAAAQSAQPKFRPSKKASKQQTGTSLGLKKKKTSKHRPRASPKLAKNLLIADNNPIMSNFFRDVRNGQAFENFILYTDSIPALVDGEITKYHLKHAELELESRFLPEQQAYQV